MVFGWTFEHIDEFVTLPQLKEMSEFWKRNPPVHRMVATYLGIGKARPSDNESVPVEEGMPAFLRDWISAGGQVPSDLLGVT